MTLKKRSTASKNLSRIWMREHAMLCWVLHHRSCVIFFYNSSASGRQTFIYCKRCIFHFASHLAIFALQNAMRYRLIESLYHCMFVTLEWTNKFMNFANPLNALYCCWLMCILPYHFICVFTARPHHECDHSTPVMWWYRVQTGSSRCCLKSLRHEYAKTMQMQHIIDDYDMC